MCLRLRLANAQFNHLSTSIKQFGNKPRINGEIDEQDPPKKNGVSFKRGSSYGVRNLYESIGGRSTVTAVVGQNS